MHGKATKDTHPQKPQKPQKPQSQAGKQKKHQKQSPPKKPSLQNNRLGLLYLATIHKNAREKWGVCPWVVSIAKPQTLPVSCCSRSCQNGCRNPPDAWHYRVLLHWLQYASWCLCLFRSHMSHELSWNLMNSLPSLFPVSQLRKRDFKLWFLADPSIIQVQLCQILGQGIATFTAFQLCELPHLFTSCGRTVASGTAGDQAIWYHKNWTVSSWSEISGWKTHCPCIERLTCRTTNWHGTSTGRNHEVWWEDRSWCLRVYLQSSFWSLISILIDTHDQFGEALLTPKSGWIAYTSGFSIFSTIW